MPTKVLYRTSATATGDGRQGKTSTDDGSYKLNLTVPKELGGSGDDGMNPEKLFALGYSACFMGAMHHYASTKKIDLPKDSTVNVSVGIGPREDSGFGLDVAILVDLPGLDRQVAQSLVDGAHRVCPYSHATAGTLTITPTLA